uniref:Ion_trans domain-containing protein n=1 Tax=Meloidogyne hapla TaxID=6305 RepID=A0A1I8B629_MELHA
MSAAIFFNIANNFQGITPTIEWYMIVLGVIYVNIGVVGIVPIIYINSSDYRKAYHDEFKKLVKLVKRNNQVTVASNNIVVMSGPQIRQIRV